MNTSSSPHEPAACTADKTIREWFKAAPVSAFNANGGVAVRYHSKQIAVFHFADTNQWFASQNMCPHKMEMALSRGIIGDVNGEHKVSCPFHKKNFSLETGKCLNDDNYRIETYPVRIEDDWVYIGIPSDL